MKKVEKLISFVMTIIFTTFILFSAIPAAAINNNAAAKKQISTANAYVVKVENITKIASFTVKTAKDSFIAAQAEVNKVREYGNVYASSYYSLTKRLNMVAAKINTRIKALDAAITAAAEISVIKAEMSVRIDKDKLINSNTLFMNAKKAVSAANTAIAKLNKNTAEYKEYMSRVNAANAIILKIQENKNVAAAEIAVEAVEIAPLATYDNITKVTELGKKASISIANVKEAKKASDFAVRLKAVSDRAAALKARLDAAALEAITPAKIVSINAVDGTITVTFNKKPITAVTSADFILTKAVNGSVSNTALKGLEVVNDNTVKITVTATAPLLNVDQSIVYSVQYLSGAAVSGTAYVVPKIPYLTVVSATSLNLRQVRVVFNKAVNKLSAETISNYIENSFVLYQGYAKAELQPDNTSVIITYASAKAQQYASSLTIMNIKNDNLTETIPNATFSLIFSDTAHPTMVSVTSSGNTKITVIFNEPVSGADNSMAYQLDGYNLSAFGLTSVMYQQDTIYPNKQTVINLTFGNRIPAGIHTFTVLDSRISDAANFYAATTSTQFTIIPDTTIPTVINALGVNDRTIAITYSEAMDVSVFNIANYTIRDSSYNVVGAISSVIAVPGQDNTYNLNLATALPGGTYTVTIYNVMDLSGNSIAGTMKSISIADTTPPLPPTAMLIDPVYKNVKVSFSEAMDYSSITTRANYQIALNGVNYTTLDPWVYITPASDYKSITLDFPDGTPIIAGVSTLKTLYIKDLAGNYTANICDSNIVIQRNQALYPAFLRARAISTTQMEIEYNKPLNFLEANDFCYNGIPAQTGYIKNMNVYDVNNTTLIYGSRITLTFRAGTINTSASGTVSVEGSIGTSDTSGSPIAGGILTTSIIDKVAPAIVSISSNNNTTIDILFSEPMNNRLGSYYKNDFVVKNGGINDAINSSVVTDSTVRLTLSSPLDYGLTTIVTPKSTISYVSDYNSNLYFPTSDDLKGITINNVPISTGVALNSVVTTPGQVATIGTANVQTITINGSFTPTAEKQVLTVYNPVNPGVLEKNTLTVGGGPASATGAITVTLNDGIINSSVNIPVTKDDSSTKIAASIHSALAANEAINNTYTIEDTSGVVSLTAKTPSADRNVSISAVPIAGLNPGGALTFTQAQIQAGSGPNLTMEGNLTLTINKPGGGLIRTIILPIDSGLNNEGVATCIADKLNTLSDVTNIYAISAGSGTVLIQDKTANQTVIPAALTITDTGTTTLAASTSTEITAPSAGDGTLNANLSQKDVTITLDPTDTTAAKVAARVATALTSDSIIGASYSFTVNGVVITITKKALGFSSQVITLTNGTATIPSSTIVTTNPGTNAVNSINQVNTVTITHSATTTGTISIRVTDGTINQTVSIAVAAGDNTSVIAAKIYMQIIGNSTIINAYNVTVSNSNIIFTRTTPTAPQPFRFVIQ